MTANSQKIPLTSKDALLIADVQNDFLAGGSLAVPRGDEVIEPLNAYIECFRRLGLPIFAIRDWHPRGHCSFIEQGGPWPAHCIAETRGAAFAASLKLPPDVQIVSKATRTDTEAYSGFSGTDLHDRLRQRDVETVFVGGLATDYCVLNTVRDALAFGFRVYVLGDAIRAVNLRSEDGEKAISEMVRLGARLISQDRIVV
ncbi:isochorismatase family protein [Methylocaldum sp.]|uniref:isochorismatase family protein n=1 Tax=Methylocaldum sp. TaxID=1969727 RepID=UPI002D2A5B6E|nr:isochorismatase family protein [Methylocaldum sp.]HYE35134.1 isochorismatase family protein [Methylocaldum sp.]